MLRRLTLARYTATMKIAIIGGGNMGEAFARAIKQHFEHGDFEVMVSEKNVEKHLAFHQLEVLTTSSNLDAADNADIVILAVKPYDIEAVCRELSVKLPGKCVVISIAAGITLASLTEWLATDRVARVMPNLLASIGKSMTVWATKLSDDEAKKLVIAILNCVGQAVELDREEDIDLAGAICGCGPAYVWYFMEKIIAAGVTGGLDPAIAKMLTMQTFLGASVMASGEGVAGDFNPLEMRMKVATKGGATQQAIDVFDARNVGGILEEAVLAAYKRCVEMGK